MEKLTLNAREVADALGLSLSLVYEAARRGELPFLRVGRRLVMPVAVLERLMGSVPTSGSDDAFQ